MTGLLLADCLKRHRDRQPSHAVATGSEQHDESRGAGGMAGSRVHDHFLFLWLGQVMRNMSYSAATAFIEHAEHNGNEFTHVQ